MLVLLHAYFRMIILFPLSVFVSLVEGAMPVGMHGDPHPPQYSSLSLHLDTYDGPVMIEPSVMGYLNDAEVMSHDYETKLCMSGRSFFCTFL
jgi:hypothetical protein